MNTKSFYGTCPHCQAPVVSRTRGIPSYDTCENDHYYLAEKTILAPKSNTEAKELVTYLAPNPDKHPPYLDIGVNPHRDFVKMLSAFPVYK